MFPISDTATVRSRHEHERHIKKRNDVIGSLKLFEEVGDHGLATLLQPRKKIRSVGSVKSTTYSNEKHISMRIFHFN